MRFAAALVVACCGSRSVLAQHDHQATVPAARSTLSFSASLAWTDQQGLRGGHQFSLLDWEHYERRIGRGNQLLSVRAMTSLGALLNDRAGHPRLLQTGGTYRHGYVHDRAHPHDLVMEAALEYRTRLTSATSLRLYVAPVGAPALGPPAYVHRSSAIADPMAPIGHHWQDATHVAYGVVGATLAARRLTLEGSAFNGRESDFKEPWPDFSRARLDSWAGRLALDLKPLVVTGWLGYLKSHDPIVPAMQMHRYGASAGLEVAGIRGGSWSSLLVWGMNTHHHDGSSHLLLHGDPNASPHVRSSSLLAETSLGIGLSSTVFARAERVIKNGEELGFQGGNLLERYDLRSVALGGSRVVVRRSAGDLLIGGRATANFIPASLELAYGSRRPAGFDIFVQARRQH